MGEIDVLLIAGLAAVAMVAGFFDAIAGGGGLITLPALLLAGVEPVAALATNKLQAASATVSATAAYARRGLIEWRSTARMAALALVGGVGGALSVSLVPRAVLEGLVPVLLLAVAAYFALAPKLTDEETRARISLPTLSFAVVPAIGFYDGVFGPGVGSFFMMALVFLAGQGIVRASATTKLMNAASNIGALLVFSAKGAILVPIALAMAGGAFIGAQLGTRCAVRFGPRLIKPLLILVCCAMAARLLLDPANPLRTLLAAAPP